jgi:hypothetical protein
MAGQAENDQSEKIWQEAVETHFRVIFRRFLAETENLPNKLKITALRA